jgi:hypothetical protein
MDTQEVVILGNSLTELVHFAWDIVVRMRNQQASDIDVRKAKSMARQLRILVEYYTESLDDTLSSTTLFMAAEVANAVDEIASHY